MKKRVLITGGAGFIGTNSTIHYLRRGWAVSIFDDLSRNGTADNLTWLRRQGPVSFQKGDLRNRTAVSRWVRRNAAGLKLVLHLAAQVAVTTSVTDPITDFDINAAGSLNLLESLRRLKKRPFTIYTSTNKVYGGMESVGVRLRGKRYGYLGRPCGIDEKEPLDFHSPYGCSKGAADQYFRDYNRIYGMPTVVLRQSCIYGPHQHGNEDQGWVAHFMRAAQSGKPITIYGDGRQVRDLLFVEDLLAAFDAAHLRRGRSTGQIYNIGGGPTNVLSLLELLAWIRARSNRRVSVKFRSWRPGDQRVYISNIRRARRELDWKPRTSLHPGLDRLWLWLKSEYA